MNASQSRSRSWANRCASNQSARRGVRHPSPYPVPEWTGTPARDQASRSLALQEISLSPIAARSWMYFPATTSNVKLSTSSVQAGDPLTVDADVKNTSQRDSDEVVELYLNFPKVPGAPIRALRGFTRPRLAAGATEHVHLELNPRDLRLVNPGWRTHRGFRLLTLSPSVEDNPARRQPCPRAHHWPGSAPRVARVATKSNRHPLAGCPSRVSGLFGRVVWPRRWVCDAPRFGHAGLTR
jgi:hypothetical protein